MTDEVQQEEFIEDICKVYTECGVELMVQGSPRKIMEQAENHRRGNETQDYFYVKQVAWDDEAWDIKVNEQPVYVLASQVVITAPVRKPRKLTAAEKRDQEAMAGMGMLPPGLHIPGMGG